MGTQGRNRCVCARPRRHDAVVGGVGRTGSGGHRIRPALRGRLGGDRGVVDPREEQHGGHVLASHEGARRRAHDHGVVGELQPAGDCSHGMFGLRCGEGDLFEPSVEASVVYGAGHVIGGSGVQANRGRRAPRPSRRRRSSRRSRPMDTATPALYPMIRRPGRRLMPFRRRAVGSATRSSRP